ncbi:hypothetical protein [Actinoplanes sp. RD1]|uniref:hypothetical protein n=1 Tax=Actinoplanes sp. RD1 TaxID=3064538 RepID=UPI002740E75D|nr:hypothetical protein [Actinoplanes sp. RD1]
MDHQAFEEPRVRRDQHLAMSEPISAWFVTVTRPEAVEGRRVINDLYSRFPDPGGRMRADLHTGDNKRFFSALDELHVHDLLARHYDVAYEEGEGTRPDFHLYRDRQYVGALEVLSLFQREDWTAEERHHAVLADELNKRLPLTTHSLMFDIQSWTGTPSLRHLVRWLDATLAELRADPKALPLDATGIPEKTYVGRGTNISFQFWALPPGYRAGPQDPVVVSGAAMGGLIDSATRLRERLDTKAGKYDLGGKPFAIAVGARDSWCTLDEVHQALTGTPAVVIATGQGIRQGDGFFGTGRRHPQGKRRHVSAVYALHDWFPGGPTEPRITRFDNPLAHQPFPADALPHHGHWGVSWRDGSRISADWLIAPTA